MNICMTKISVVVPVYNGEKYLENCLLSLLNQNYYNFEIIVVDNNSTDKTKLIINRLQTKNPHIIYLSEKKQGRGSARNAGIDKAASEIIAMTDVDCIVPVNWLKEISSPIINKQAKVVMGFEKDAVGNYFSRIRQEEDWLYIKSKIKGNFIDHLDTKNFAIETKLIKKLKFDSTLSAYEDWDLFIRLKNKNIKIFFLPKLLVSHYHNSNVSEIYNTQKERGENLARAINKYKNNLKFNDIISDESGKSIKLRNFLFFLPWAVWQLISNPRKAPYKIISDFSWKIGIIAYLLSKISKKNEMKKEK